MDAPESPSTVPADPDLASAFDRLRIIVAQREAEHARQGRYRIWFGRGVLLFIFLVFGGLYALVETFNVDVFTKTLEGKVSDGAPAVMNYGRQTVQALAPVYQKEVERTMPQFLKQLSDISAAEAGHLADAVAPLARGDASVYTVEADAALAKGLQAKFNKTLKSEDEAKGLAAALRTQQLAAAPQMLDGPLAGPFGALHDIEMSLRNMGPPDEELLAKGDTIDALGKAALDVVKTRLISGEGFGFEEDKDAKKSSPAKKGGK